MKGYTRVTTISTSALLLVACGSEEDAQTIVENAIDTHENVVSYYQSSTSVGGEEGVVASSEVWYVKENDRQSYRKDILTEEWDELVGYHIRAIDHGKAYHYVHPSQLLYHYEDELSMFEQREQDSLAESLRDFLSDYETTFVGEEEISGYDTYHIQFEADQHVHNMWFDQETYYLVKQTTVDSAGEIGNLIKDYELEIDYDPAVFEIEGVLGDEVQVVEDSPV